MKPTLLRWITCSALLVNLNCSPVHGAQHALLVGVAEYPHLAPALQLEGPRQDIPRLRAMLLEQGFSEDDITVVADGVPGAQALPTRAAIEQALEKLTRQAGTGDFVFLHFSGHGTQAPAQDAESDGLDELLLPRDVRNWNYEKKRLPNALYDQDVGRWLDRLRAKGANVWVVFDSCHSGTMTRSVGDASVRMRRAPPALLDIPETRSRGARGNDTSPGFVELSEGRGDLIAFFAAQSHETTPEMRLPQNTSDGEFNGLFTYTLSTLIASRPNLSYRQLAQLVNTRYDALPWRATTPLAVGTAMDRRIFHRGKSRPRRYAVEREGNRLLISAGRLHSFEQGAVLGLYASVTAKAPIKEVVVEDAELTRSWSSVPESFDASPSWAGLQQPALEAKRSVRWAKAPAEPWAQATADLSQNAFLSRTLRWVDPAEDADLLLYAQGERLFFINRDDRLPCDMLQQLDVATTRDCAAQQSSQLRSMQVTGNLDIGAASHVLLQGLKRWVRAANLIRAAADLHDTSALRTDFEYRHAENGTWRAYDPARPLTLYAGDTVRFSITNESDTKRDTTVLFLDGNYGITQVYPEPGQAGRIAPGENVEVLAATSVTADTTGTEQLLVLATPVTREVAAADYTWMQQPPMGSGRIQAKTRSRGISQPTGLLAEAMGELRQTKSRGLGLTPGNTKAPSTTLIRWQTGANTEPRARQ